MIIQIDALKYTDFLSSVLVIDIYIHKYIFCYFFFLSQESRQEIEGKMLISFGNVKKKRKESAANQTFRWKFVI